jgi:hypothetical protein
MSLKKVNKIVIGLKNIFLLLRAENKLTLIFICQVTLQLHK